MKSFVLSISFISFLTLGFLSNQAQAEVLSFKSWKTARTESARQAFERFQAEVTANPPRSPGQLHKPPHTEARLAQAKLNLEIAQELNAHDYFVLYLSQLGNESDFQEGSKKLAPEEIAEILTAVKKQTRFANSDMEASLPLIVPAANAKATAHIRQ